MNKLASTELFATTGTQCDKCGMDLHKGHGCCRDEVKIVKMQEDQKLNTVFSFQLALLESPVVLPSEFIVASFYNTPATKHYQNHSPPLLASQETYLENCVFRL
jgi:hypothetical protein